MAKALSIFSILCIIGFTCGKWLPQVTVVSEDQEAEFLKYHGFTDNSTGITYLTWIKPSDYSVYVCRVLPDGRVDGKTKLTTDQSTTYEMKTRVSGLHNGRNVYVTFVAKRSREEEAFECSQYDKRGCSDIYFSESENSGQTWSKPVSVPREDQNDALHRVEVETVPSWVNGRIWVLYLTYSDSSPNDVIMGMVTRPFGSRIFTNEQVIRYNPGGLMRLSLNYHYGDNIIPTLSIFWKKDAKAMIIESRTSGLTWSKPKEVKACEGSDETISIQSGGMALPGHLFALCKAGEDIYSTFSVDKGATWEGKVQFKGPLVTWDSCFTSDGTKDNALEMFIYDGEKQTMLGYALVGSNDMKETAPKPFAALAQYGVCRYVDGKHQFGLLSLRLDNNILKITIDMNDNVMDSA